jgi:diguanylate cyclase (GGDEF)-like protein
MGIEIMKHETQTIARENPNPVLQCDLQGTLLFANAGAEELLDYWNIRCGMPLGKTMLTKLQNTIDSQQLTVLELPIKQKLFFLRFVPFVARGYVNIYGFDLSLCHYTPGFRLSPSLYDEITGLPNRHQFITRLEAEMYVATEERKQAALLLLDIKQFTVINQTFGHAVADGLLSAVANRLLTSVPSEYAIARVGDNQYGIIRSDLTADVEAASLAQVILDNITLPYAIQGHDIVISARIGIALFPMADASNAASILRYAVLALTRAKEHHGNNYQFFASAMSLTAESKHNLMSELRYALPRDELLLYYQPQYALPSQQVVGMEALVRWQHPTHGLMTPGRFTSLAEQSGLIVSIGEWVLKVACHQTKRWHDQGFSALRVSVNISPLQFKQQDLVAGVRQALLDTGLDPACLVLEITETALIEDIAETISILNQLRQLGVKLAIDDFGIGYSSFNYLKQLPVHKLKIDRSFTLDITDDPEQRTVVDDIIKMGHKLKMEIIAEGVEKKSQLEFLTQHGCEEVQGYLFSEPLPMLAFDTYLKQQAAE